MLTPEEIENIAKQYAEFTDLSVVDQLRVKLISKEFLTWVLRDYCIVPKSQGARNLSSYQTRIRRRRLFRISRRYKYGEGELVKRPFRQIAF